MAILKMSDLKFHTQKKKKIFFNSILFYGEANIQILYTKYFLAADWSIDMRPLTQPYMACFYDVS
jgi:hypothetical protein